MATDYKKMFEGKSLDELNEIRKALDDYVKQEKVQLEQEQAYEIAKGLTILTPVYFMVGKGKDAHPAKGTVIQLTSSGVTAELDDGRKVTRRYKKLLTKDRAKELGLQE